MATTKSSNLSKYLQEHEHKRSPDKECTHTRIGSKDSGIYAGAYHIPETDWKNFMQTYYQNVIVKGQLEYLTEKQLVENGPIMLDFDFKYDTTITTRQHKPEHIEDALLEYMAEISKLVDITDGTNIEVFVMEKNDVNKLADKTKDGIHIIIGVQMHKALQAILRTAMIPIIKDLWDDLPIKNDWHDVFDEGVTKGSVNWQIYGSRKPDHEAYMVKYHYVFNYSTAEEWTYREHPLNKFSTEKNILKLSARYTEYPGFPMKEEVYEAFEISKRFLNKKEGNKDNAAAANAKQSKKILAASTITSFSDIRDEATLDAELAIMFDLDTIDPTEYKLKEAHDYTMILPVSYYGPGSYNKWIKVGMALRNESPKLFLTWLKFSCQENCRDTLKGANGKFDWSSVPELHSTWERFAVNRSNPLTHKSIMYWGRTEVREKYDEIWKQSTNFYVEQSLQGGTEFDLAAVLYSMRKDKYVCTSIKNKVWYEYINHRWHEIDSGNTLRMTISKEMHKIYADRLSESFTQVQLMDPSKEEERNAHMKKNKILAEIAISLKKTQPKQNVMSEACLHFYDKRFLEQLDNNTHLLCFNNGVIDFKQKVFRKGNPEDCLSKCTGNDYTPYDIIMKNHSKIVAEINTFMKQVFPIKEVEEYMWDHLASCLIGVNKNQTFNVYIGCGANGKSMVVDLMSKSLGTYAQSMSATLLTTKPAAIGSTSSELAQTPGARLLTMAETSKGAKLEEGTMKLFSGGDKIQARQLFQESMSFTPQFKMVLMTNHDLEITAVDDGTWRRLRYVDFVSKFYDYEGQFPRSEYPYQFPRDESLKEKLDDWAPIFISLLVERAFKTDGLVKDCETVLRASKKKRDNSDYLAGFMSDKVRQKEGRKIKKTELLEEFKNWYQENNPGKAPPKGKEVVDMMNLKFGECTKNGWRNVEIIPDDDDEDDGETP